MACTSVVVCLVCLLLGSSFSLPITLDVKTVQLFDNENSLTERTVLKADTILNFGEEIEYVQRLTTENVMNVFGSVDEAHGERIKRYITKPGPQPCPNDTYEYGGRCLTKEQYDDYNEE